MLSEKKYKNIFQFQFYNRFFLDFIVIKKLGFKYK